MTSYPCNEDRILRKMGTGQHLSWGPARRKTQASGSSGAVCGGDIDRKWRSRLVASVDESDSHAAQAWLVQCSLDALQLSATALIAHIVAVRQHAQEIEHDVEDSRAETDVDGCGGLGVDGCHQGVDDTDMVDLT